MVAVQQIAGTAISLNVGGAAWRLWFFAVVLMVTLSSPSVALTRIDCSGSLLFFSSKLDCFFKGNAAADDGGHPRTFHTLGGLSGEETINLSLFLPKSGQHYLPYTAEQSKEALRVFNDVTSAATSWGAYKGFKSTGYITFRSGDRHCVGIDHGGPPEGTGYSYLVRGFYCRTIPLGDVEKTVRDLLQSARVGGTDGKSALGAAWTSYPADRGRVVTTTTTLSSPPRDMPPQLHAAKRGKIDRCEREYTLTGDFASTSFPADNTMSYMKTFSINNAEYGEAASCICYQNLASINNDAEKIYLLFDKMKDVYLGEFRATGASIVSIQKYQKNDEIIAYAKMNATAASGREMTLLLMLRKNRRVTDCLDMLAAAYRRDSDHQKALATGFMSVNEHTLSP